MRKKTKEDYFVINISLYLKLLTDGISVCTSGITGVGTRNPSAINKRTHEVTTKFSFVIAAVIEARTDGIFVCASGMTGVGTTIPRTSTGAITT